MNGDVIKSFLVGLGFGVDEASLSKFNKAITSASIKVTALYASIKIASAGIFAAIAGVSKGFEDMGYELRIIQPAMNRWLVMRQAMLDAYRRAGVNLTQVVKQSVLFNYSLAKTRFALEAVYKSVASRFFPLLTKQMDIFRSKIFANMPKIQAQLQKFIEFIFKAFRVTVELGTRLWSILTRVYDFFERLHKATKGWSTAILAVAAAWKIFNLSFLATPLGMLLALGLAILTLYDDLKVFLDGGKSLINWGSDTTKLIVGLLEVINPFTHAFEALKIIATVFGYLGGQLTAFFSKFEIGVRIINIFKQAVVDTVSAITSLVGAMGNLISPLWGTLKNFLITQGGNTLATIGGANQAGLQRLNMPQPLLPGGSASHQSVKQETNINVNSSADANAVGKSVASQQDRVNFDMTRNLKGAMQ